MLREEELKMHGTRSVLILAVAALALALAACGGNPASPSGMTGGVAVRGVLLGEGAAVGASSVRASSSSGSQITVTVEGNPSLTTTISGNGTFELEGVPAGTFTLTFTKDGVVIGTVTITAGDGVEVKIVVKMEGAVIVLVDLELEDNDDNDDANKTCLIEGGRVGDRIELEGRVTSVTGTSFQMTTEGERAHGTVNVSASGASFKCNGDKGSADCKTSLKAGDKVHVRGTLTSCSLEQASVTATEVKVQKSDDDEDEDDDD